MGWSPQRREPKPLTQAKFDEAMDYFSNLPLDFFGTNRATENDFLLFLDVACTAAVLKPPRRDTQGFLDEYFIGIKSECKRL
jgi:hypothetical protein